MVISKTAQSSFLTDPTVFAVNRLPAVSDHAIYPSLAAARADARTELWPDSPFYQLLDGEWRLQWHPHGMPELPDFPTGDLTDWDIVMVPGHLQLQHNGKYGKPQYLNTTYPWEGISPVEPPRIPAKNPVAVYTLDFDASDALQGTGRAVLSLQGVEPCAFVWLNGIFVGYAEDSFTPSEFDVTPLLKKRDNRLCVAVFRYCSGSWLEDQDFFRFFGIFRSVMLRYEPMIHLQDLRLHTALTADFSSGTLTAQMSLSASGTVIGRLLDSTGNPVATAGCSGTDVRLEFMVANPLLWSSETPHLYTLELEIGDGTAVTEATTEVVGFRRFVLEDNVMKLNGKRLLLHGVNRHEFNCRTGRCITAADMLQDILFCKQNNINAVRTCHYPDHSLWYRLCDRYGIYLIDETNLETHGTWDCGQEQEEWVPGDHEEWLCAVLDRGNSMLRRDVNHPSILFWSCGNESRGGLVIWELSQFFRREDPTRLVHYEGCAEDARYPDTSDVYSRMYFPPQKIEKYVQEDHRPFINCEFMHAMGNSCGGIRLYTDLEDRYERYQGGFIWDFMDQALLLEGNGYTRLGYGGDYDDRPNNGNFSGNGILFADRTPSPKVTEVKVVYQPFRFVFADGQVTVESRLLFAETVNMALYLTLLCDGRQVIEESKALRLQPGGSASFPLPCPASAQPGEWVVIASVRLTAATPWAEDGHEIAFDQTVLCRMEPPVTPLAEPHLGRGRRYFGIDCGATHSLASYGAGLLSLKAGDYEWLAKAPRPVFWRALTDNDRGCGLGYRNGFWETASRYTIPKTNHYVTKDGLPQHTVVWQLSPAGKGRAEIQTTWLTDGRIRMECALEDVAELPPLPIFGMQWVLPLSCQSFTYYGMGPEENYCDRLSGCRLGRWDAAVSDQLTPYLKPQECGNRCGVRQVELHGTDGHRLIFTAENDPFDLQVLPYTYDQLEAAHHPDELPPPRYTVVRIAGAQDGVGGDDSWGAPVQERYRIPHGQSIRFSYLISWN